MASKRRLRRKSCGNKVKYFTQEKAIHAARVVSVNAREGFHAYKCDFGNHYHIAHYRSHGNLSVFVR